MRWRADAAGCGGARIAAGEAAARACGVKEIAGDVDAVLCEQRLEPSILFGIVVAFPRTLHIVLLEPQHLLLESLNLEEKVSGWVEWCK
jgi:hypothetical protein